MAVTAEAPRQAPIARPPMGMVPAPPAEVMVSETMAEMVVAFAMPEVVLVESMEWMAEETVTEAAMTATAAMRRCRHARDRDGQQQGGNECEHFPNGHRAQRDRLMRPGIIALR